MGNRQSVPAAGQNRQEAGGDDNHTGPSVTGADGVTGAAAGTIAVTAGAPEVEVEGKDPDWDQCGLDPDPEGLWEEDVPDPRIKESSLTPAEKTKFLGHLAKIFHEDAVKGIRIQFKAQDVAEVCDKVIPYLASEPTLIEDVPFDITIVADLHGQLFDLNRVFRGDAKDGKPGWECQKYLFLGDYVDRGRQSLEIVMALFCIKMLYPDRVFLLRGNHEFVATNAKNGFILDFVDRYSKNTCNKLFFKVNEAFCYLSIAAIVGDSYFCAHAGISPQAFTRRHFRGVNKPITDSKRDNLIHDVVWSDVARGLHGTTYNGNRMASVFYGMDELALALDNVDCTTLFRGHTILNNGFDIIGGLCIGLFTATGVNSNHNDGAVAVIDKDGKMFIRLFKCNPARVEWEAALKQRDGGGAEEDALTVDDDSGGGSTAAF